MFVNCFNKGQKLAADELREELLEELEYGLVSKKMSKITDPTGNKIVTSTSGGDIVESEITMGDVISKITSPSGNKIGGIWESLYLITDVHG